MSWFSGVMLRRWSWDCMLLSCDAQGRDSGLLQLKSPRRELFESAELHFREIIGSSVMVLGGKTAQFAVGLPGQCSQSHLIPGEQSWNCRLFSQGTLGDSALSLLRSLATVILGSWSWNGRLLSHYTEMYMSITTSLMNLVPVQL